MIKETLITLTVGATLVEKDRLPDLPHKSYPSLNETYNAVLVYGKMLNSNQINNPSVCNFSTMLVTQ